MSARSPEDPLPTVRAQVRLDEAVPVYDVRFCPYVPLEEPPIFAFVAAHTVHVCRAIPKSKRGEPVCEIIQTFYDADKSIVEEGKQHNSLTWAQNPETGDPWIAFTGMLHDIKVVDVKTGNLVRTLVGHGGPVNDIQVSPVSSSTIASCGEDQQIRLWNLKKDYVKHPCAVMCSGAGHRSQIYAIAFHENGRWLLSASYDSWIHLWALPDVEELENLPTLPTPETGHAKTKHIYYPHFSSAEMCAQSVDCVRFYGDLILTRAALSDSIVLWRIDGFQASDPAPASPPTDVSPRRLTRSAFGGQFTRLMQFKARETDQNYIRFGLFNAPNRHPVLAIGNSWGNVSMWDLQLLEGMKADGITPAFHGDAFGDIEPHRVLKLPSPRKDGKKSQTRDTARALAWSPNGNWLVAAFDSGLLLICSRE